MKKQALTPWFPPSVSPVRDGVYQRMYDEGPAYCYWNGRCFCIGTLIDTPNALTLALNRIIPAPCQDLPWRGLANPPKEKS